MEALTKECGARVKVVGAVKCEDRSVWGGWRGWIKRVVTMGLRLGVGSKDRVSVMEDHFGFLGIRLGGLEARYAIRRTLVVCFEACYPC
jgi:hypothetical protein